MYFIVVYDMDVARVNKIHKFLRCYFHWIQNSVFEGEIGKGDFKVVDDGVKKIIKGRDSVIFYEIKGGKNALERRCMGRERKISNILE